MCVVGLAELHQNVANALVYQMEKNIFSGKATIPNHF